MTDNLAQFGRGRATWYEGSQMEGPPTKSGRAGKAWRMPLAEVGKRSVADWDATVAIFVVHAPGITVAWDHWSISVIHLRPIPGVPDAAIRSEGATHEFVIAALDPGHILPRVNAWSDWRFLQPVDVVEQFKASTDAVADRILELAVDAIVRGVASPDQDWRPWWKAAIAQTAEYYDSGLLTIGTIQ